MRRAVALVFVVLALAVAAQASRVQTFAASGLGISTTNTPLAFTDNGSGPFVSGR
jgi:hypothetical protein